MLTELFPLTLTFRGLSDEDGDEIELDSPDIDEDDGDDEDDKFAGGEGAEDAPDDVPLE